MVVTSEKYVATYALIATLCIQLSITIYLVIFCIDLALHLRTRDSHKTCPSIVCASPRGVKPTPLEWRMCCEPDDSISSQYVTYHKLIDSDRNLSAVLARYNESNVVGLIIINTNNSLFLSDEFIKNSDSTSLSLPIYIVSLRKGEVLKKFLLEHRGKEVVEVKVSVESAVDSEFVIVAKPHTLSGLCELCVCVRVCVYIIIIIMVMF